MKITQVTQQLNKTTAKLTNVHEALKQFHQKKYTHENISQTPKTFQFLCGLSVEQFDLLFKCVSPYCQLIRYPDCKGTGQRIMDKETELLAVLTICRHSLGLGMLAYIVDLTPSTVHRIFVGWVVFLEAIFSQLDLKPDGGFLLNKMPEIFVRTGHGFNRPCQ